MNTRTTVSISVEEAELMLKVLLARTTLSVDEQELLETLKILLGTEDGNA